jgi:ATP-dependent DNA helicase RecQ
MNEMLQKSLELLKKYYGYQSFRKGQEVIIENILSGKDVLAIMPTGGGKSLCYQIPAMMMEGTVIVISPLISLMKDQVDTLQQLGIPAAFINSSLSWGKLNEIVFEAIHNRYKLLYVAPERLESGDFIELLKNIKISMIAVDEAHCVSQWGHDFRPSYLKIKDIRNIAGNNPIISAFTATATPEVKEDIINLIDLRNHYEIITGFDRENLKFEVVKTNKKMQYVLNFAEENKGKSGIIYCLTRKTTDDVCSKLVKAGHKAVSYHAGLSNEERNISQDDFLFDNADIIVATNAFGMGIDKLDIRFVIHYNMPKNVESYYQEAGRAGRDGEKSECILLYSPQDIVMNKFLIENSSGEGTMAGDYVKLRDMVNYCNTDKCLRRYLISYFDTGYNIESCNNCGNCLNEIESQDITVETQKILSCIYRMEQRFGSNVVIDVLKGSGSQRIKSLNFHKLSTYGIMKEYDKDTLKDMISYLISDGYINIAGDKYPVLNISKLGYSVLKGAEKVEIKKVFTKKAMAVEYSYDKELFEILRALRKEISEELKVPPFVVFSDVTLKDMCVKYPLNERAMLNVTGVGEFKAKKYGNIFIEKIKEHVGKNNIDINKKPEISMQSEENKKERKSRTVDKGIDTRTLSYNLYKDGKGVKEIAGERDLSTKTVEDHLIYCAKLGFEINYHDFVSNDKEKMIVNAYKKIGGDKLKPIKEALPEDISYTEIKFALCKYNIGEKHE